MSLWSDANDAVKLLVPNWGLASPYENSLQELGAKYSFSKVSVYFARGVSLFVNFAAMFALDALTLAHIPESEPLTSIAVVLGMFLAALIVMPYIEFQILKVLGVIRIKTPVEVSGDIAREPKYDYDDAAQTVLEYLQSKGTEDVSKSEIKSMLQETYRIVDQTPKNPDPGETLARVAQSRGYNRKIAYQLYDGDTTYLEKIGIIK